MKADQQVAQELGISHGAVLAVKGTGELGGDHYEVKVLGQVFPWDFFLMLIRCPLGVPATSMVAGMAMGHHTMASLKVTLGTPITSSHVSSSSRGTEDSMRSITVLGSSQPIYGPVAW